MNSCPNCGVEDPVYFASLFGTTGVVCPQCLLLLRRRMTAEEQAILALYRASETQHEFKIDLED